MTQRRRALSLGIAGLMLATACIASTVTAQAEPTVDATPAAAESTCTTATSPAARGMRLAWHDEFSGTSLDSNRWSTVMDFPGRAGGHYHNTSYGSYAVDENVVLSQGRLQLVTDNK